MKYKLDARASASTRTPYEEDKNTEAQRTQSYPSHLPSVTSVPLCFKSASPMRIAIKINTLVRALVGFPCCFWRPIVCLVDFVVIGSSEFNVLLYDIATKKELPFENMGFTD